MTYETEKQRKRKDQAKSRATSLHIKASHQLAHADNGIKDIPVGQPILVGHHSERRHRKAIATAQRLTRQAIETYKDAKSAEWSAHNAGHAITSDDPEALIALRSKLADLLEILAEYEFRLVEGSNDLIQCESLIAQICSLE